MKVDYQTLNILDKMRMATIVDEAQRNIIPYGLDLKKIDSSCNSILIFVLQFGFTVVTLVA